MEKITKQTFDMLNEAVKLSGIEGLGEVTQQNITTLLQLPDAQLQTIINNLYLVSEQRGFQNLWSSEDNPFREFLFDMKNNGWTIQDYMIDILEGMTPYWDESYTDAQVAEGLVKDYEQKFESAFHMTPFSKQFATTINEKDYSKYFYPYSLQSFVDMKINNLPSSAEIYLEKQVLIDEVKQMITDNDIIVKAGYDPNSDIGIKHMIEDMKTVYKSFKQPTNLYNKKGVISITPSEDMIFTFMKPSTMERLKVYVNSAAYNLNEVMLSGRVIFIPEDMTLGTDGSGNEILAIILDRRSLVVGLRTWKMRDFEIPNKLRRNYFLSIEGIRGHNNFINAVAFKGATVANFLNEGSDSNAYVAFIPISAFAGGEHSVMLEAIRTAFTSFSIDDKVLNLMTIYNNPVKFNKTFGFTISNTMPEIYTSGPISIYGRENSNKAYSPIQSIYDLIYVNGKYIEGEYLFDFENKNFVTPSQTYTFSQLGIGESYEILGVKVWS